MKMMKEDLEAIIGRIRERRPYIEIYYKQYGYKPQWLNQRKDNKAEYNTEYKRELVDFEEWLISYKREERINKLLGE